VRCEPLSNSLRSSNRATVRSGSAQKQNRSRECSSCLTHGDPWGRTASPPVPLSRRHPVLPPDRLRSPPPSSRPPRRRFHRAAVGSCGEARAGERRDEGGGAGAELAADDDAVGRGEGGGEGLQELLPRSVTHSVGFTISALLPWQRLRLQRIRLRRRHHHPRSVHHGRNLLAVGSFSSDYIKR
jgi:hypothetical protein